MTWTKTNKAFLGLCAGLLLSAGACDTAEPDDGMDPAEFRCSFGTIPGVGARNDVFVSGTAQIYGAGGNGNFDVFSNTSVNVSGGGKIWGNAYTPDNEDINVFNSGYIWGQGEGDPIEVPDWIPWDDVNTIWNKRRNNNIGSTAYGRDPTYYYNRKLRLYGGDYLWLPGGRYYFTQLDIASGADLRIYGDVTIVIDGPMSVSDNAKITAYNNADILFIGADDQPIEFSNGSRTNMRLYAPRAPVMVSGNGTQFSGSIVGNTLQVSGSSLLEVTSDALHIWNPC